MSHVDAHASERQYADHLLPVWRALPDHRRGTFSTTSKRVLQWLDERGVLAEFGRPRGSGTFVLAASLQDVRAALPRRAIMLEHGAGQTYAGSDHGSYSGGRERESVALFLCPSETVARRNLDRYPRARARVVGVPKLDFWHQKRGDSVVDRRLQDGGSGFSPSSEGRKSEPPFHGAPSGGGTRRPVVAVSFHWNPSGVAPEARGAWDHYRQAFEELAASDRPFELIGHGHPRLWPKLRPWWERIGVEPVEEFSEVLERADLYVCDNSSTLYEFASTDRPVVVLDAPHYRRDVEHGLRFWEHADVGLRADMPDPFALALAIEWSLQEHPEAVAIRRRIVAAVYPLRDGRAAERAAAAIEEVLEVHDDEGEVQTVEIGEFERTLAEPEQQVVLPAMIARRLRGVGIHPGDAVYRDFLEDWKDATDQERQATFEVIARIPDEELYEGVRRYVEEARGEAEHPAEVPDEPSPPDPTEPAAGGIVGPPSSQDLSGVHDEGLEEAAKVEDAVEPGTVTPAQEAELANAGAINPTEDLEARRAELLEQAGPPVGTTITTSPGVHAESSTTQGGQTVEVKVETPELVETPAPELADIPASDVPPGSVDDVLAWVGKDRRRADVALQVEKENREGGPRKTVVEPLEKLIATAGGSASAG